MEVAKIFENLPKSKIYGIMGNINLTTNNINYGIVNNFNFSGTVREFLNNKKDIQALKMVFLDETYLDKRVEDLSVCEIKEIILASILLKNTNYIVLDYFEKELTDQKKDNFKRLFKKLANLYNKTIIINTNDITFLWDIADSILHYESDTFTTYEKDQYFELANIVNTPEIIKFINYIKSKNIAIDNYKNCSDLLKAVYRLKGE